MGIFRLLLSVMIMSPRWVYVPMMVGVAAVSLMLILPIRPRPNPFFALVVKGDLADFVVQSQNTTLADVRDDFGNGLLHWAAKAGQVEVCLHLLSYVNARATNHAGSSALHWAVYSPNRAKDVIKILIEAGLHPDSVNHNHESPLHWAVDWNRPNAAEALLLEGADPNLADNNQDTPLHRIPEQCTESSSCAALLRLLLKHGANAAAVNKFGRVALAHVDWAKDKSN